MGMGADATFTNTTTLAFSCSRGSLSRSASACASSTHDVHLEVQSEDFGQVDYERARGFKIVMSDKNVRALDHAARRGTITQCSNLTLLHT